MSTKNSTDPSKKHWFLLLVIVPIILTLIAILPNLLKSRPDPTPDDNGKSNSQQDVKIYGNENQVQIGDGNTQTSQ